MERGARIERRSVCWSRRRRAPLVLRCIQVEEVIVFATIIYVLCALTSGLCAVLLLRGYARSRARLLFWSGLCFVGLALNNFLLVLDVNVISHVDLSTWR